MGIIRFKPGDIGSIGEGKLMSMIMFPSGATDPDPEDKALFFNTTENKLKRHDGTKWIVIDALDDLERIKDGLITDAKIDAAAGIAKSKLAALNIVNIDIDEAADIAKSKLAALNIIDADIDAEAEIAKSKLAALNIMNADIDAAAAIAKSKLGALGIVDTDVAVGASITKDKLAALNIEDIDVLAIGQGKITDLVTNLADKVESIEAEGINKITGINWDKEAGDFVLNYKEIL